MSKQKKFIMGTNSVNNRDGSLSSLDVSISVDSPIKADLNEFAKRIQSAIEKEMLRWGYIKDESGNFNIARTD